MSGRAPLRDGLIAALVGAALRLGVVAWAAGRFPPVEDARFYHQLAARLAAGRGYTWLWPDGVVTYVAHYPVGYPALLAAPYAVLGPNPLWGMLLNAVLGALAVLAVHRVAASSSGRGGALLAALAVALHPALVFYTPALMTEGVTAALFAVGAWLAARAAGASRPLVGWLGLGAVLGFAALVRGQSALLVPLFAWVAAGQRPSWRRLGLTFATVTLAAACVVLPWTARNCRRMDRCVVVSANLGWNLLIGSTENANGTFVPITGESVPERCRTVFGEADKDACFAAEAVRMLRARPLRFLALAPRKLAYTFEYCGAAGWYLNASGPSHFSERAKLWLGAAETLLQRALVLLALLGVARTAGAFARARQVAAALAGLLLFTPFAWVAYLALATLALAPRELRARPGLALGALATLATAFTHAVFFGAGRYSLVVYPLVAAMAGLALTARRDPGGCPRFDIPEAAG